jgi:SlyX protein
MDQRIIELEIRLTHLEDTIEVLNDTVIKQRDAIDILQLQISHLEKKLKASQQATPVAHESEETPPPHY